MYPFNLTLYTRHITLWQLGGLSFFVQKKKNTQNATSNKQTEPKQQEELKSCVMQIKTREQEY